MKYKIHYTKESRRDLDEIWDYISSELQNTSSAERTVNRIMDDVDRLADFAEIGAPLSSIADVDSDYRFLVTGSYLTFYRVYGSDIYVDRVLYGRRDYLRILFDKLQDDETN
ncbi:type II toxin-antitoxin system RelE/ParE family toxin [uncultured Dysosmobacter sp.]|uniref:type II toxin-antitoxin system RelE/ParE family toxin n=1 Tax=uncultured Dysosmobacter sp. TaxID=2591384 RepID=UPI00261F47C0|nr:type II toxin-antitoxin system RelE/ParE family toxin [uncultured Dysosmobacter sp.]